jgi:DNA-binding NarL/FixJ family response regulator
MYSVLLADDHRIVCDGIRALLGDSGIARVTAIAKNGEEAVALAQSTQPDVAILDITMRGLSGIDAARQIRAALPDCRLIMLSMHSTAAHVRSAFEAGAHGYLLKESAADEVVNAILTVMHGERFVCSRLRKAGIVSDPSADPLAILSERERHVLHLMVDGKTCAEMAAVMSLSVKTVETYRSRVMNKLDLHDVTELVRFALRHALTPL